jgi:hypothetical protein
VLLLLRSSAKVRFDPSSQGKDLAMTEMKMVSRQSSVVRHKAICMLRVVDMHVHMLTSQHLRNCKRYNCPTTHPPLATAAGADGALVLLVT